jgi:hypothetical protein
MYVPTQNLRPTLFELPREDWIDAAKGARTDVNVIRIED